MSFWTDAKVVDDFTPEDKYFYLYLLTNPHTNLCGCYEISTKQMSDETGYSRETITKLIDRMEKIHKTIIYRNKELLIVNWSKHNWTSSDKFRKPLASEIDDVKDDGFKEFLTGLYNGDTVSIPYRYPIDTTVTVTDTVSVPVSDSAPVRSKSLNNIELFNNFISDNKDIEDELNNLDLLDIVTEWLTYKDEQKDHYKETSIKTLVKKVIKAAEEYSARTVTDLIEDSISSGYKGIIWDKLKKDSGSGSGSAYLDRIDNRISDVDKWAKEIEERHRQKGDTDDFFRI